MQCGKLSVQFYYTCRSDYGDIFCADSIAMDMKNGDCFEEIMKCLGYKKIDCEIDSTAGKDTNAISGDLTAIVMNALANWLQLVGQVIQLYNSQQQYFQ